MNKTLKKEELKKFIKSIKSNPHEKLDEWVHTLHEDVFLEVDCLACAKCCKGYSPIIINRDIERISKKLKMKPSEFYEKHVTVDSDGEMMFQKQPCIFLDQHNYCEIYDIRPRACKEYPHTDRTNFVQILELTAKNYFICPAVGLILDRLKEKIKMR